MITPLMSVLLENNVLLSKKRRTSSIVKGALPLRMFRSRRSLYQCIYCLYLVTLPSQWKAHGMGHMNSIHLFAKLAHDVSSWLSTRICTQTCYLICEIAYNDILFLQILSSNLVQNLLKLSKVT